MIKVNHNLTVYYYRTQSARDAARCAYEKCDGESIQMLLHSIFAVNLGNNTIIKSRGSIEQVLEQGFSVSRVEIWPKYFTLNDFN